MKECIVIAQDITRYGIDLYGEKKLAALLRELCKLDFRWIRLHYLCLLYTSGALRICRQNIRRNDLTGRVVSLQLDAREKPPAHLYSGYQGRYCNAFCPSVKSID